LKIEKGAIKKDCALLAYLTYFTHPLGYG
jgi:hypothetical protein